MAFSHGKDLAFKLDNAADALTDISAFVNSVDLTDTGEIGETTTADGTGAKTFIPGLRPFTVSIEGIFDPTVDAILDAAVNTLKTFEFGPDGLDGGDVRRTGEVICTSYNPPANVAESNVFTAEFQGTGVLTRDTV